MTINARAVALHGLGFAVALVAVQGLATIDAQQDLQTTPGYVAAAGREQRAAAADAVRRAALAPQVLRVESGEGRAADAQASSYRASSARRDAAAGGDNLRTAHAEEPRRAASRGTTRKA